MSPSKQSSALLATLSSPQNWYIPPRGRLGRYGCQSAQYLAAAFPTRDQDMHYYGDSSPKVFCCTALKVCTPALFISVISGSFTLACGMRKVLIHKQHNACKHVFQDAVPPSISSYIPAPVPSIFSPLPSLVSPLSSSWVLLPPWICVFKESFSVASLSRIIV